MVVSWSIRSFTASDAQAELAAVAYYPVSISPSAGWRFQTKSDAGVVRGAMCSDAQPSRRRTRARKTASTEPPA
ncbi:hypothetical protein GSI_11353 [Ganoderma sinense ZZ0214-1]|uniref:Uncharacterized protein n=1 Tax=Ganoderma sinense ZZ0214-1 TaxID=1077348 RepID=A0A2G8RVR4_9APHY|nr:hypothetical protein GSI_11353 [Ganoderma sinense ZZ0214-1]